MGEFLSRSWLLDSCVSTFFGGVDSDEERKRLLLGKINIDMMEIWIRLYT